MIETPLTQGYVMWSSDEDVEEASKGWYAASMSRGIYAVRTVYSPKKTLFFHREIFGSPEGREVDHIRGTLLPGSRHILDNRRDNLRVCSKLQNKRGHMAEKVGTSSLYRGVTWHKASRRWRARIGLSPGVRICLGYFIAEEDAARAYDVAAREHFGDFASLNFPT